MICGRNPLILGAVAVSVAAGTVWAQAEVPLASEGPEISDVPDPAPPVRPIRKPDRQLETASEASPDEGPDTNPEAEASSITGFSWDLELPSHRALARVRKNYDLAPFTTDGCSGGMSATWRVIAQSFPGFDDLHGDLPPWEDCCIVHDRAYHDAGPDPAPDASFTARLTADEALRQCVRDTARNGVAELAESYGVSEAFVIDGYTAMGDAMFAAVRAGGMPCSGLPWRWGYGYPLCLVGPQDFLGWE